MTKRSVKAKTPPTPPPPLSPEALQRLALWDLRAKRLEGLPLLKRFTGDSMGLQGFPRTLAELLRSNAYVLPDYQRGAVWTLDRTLEFLNFILDSGIVMPLVMIRSTQGRSLVVDGQQRLRALLVLVRRLDGSGETEDHGIRLDPETCRFVHQPNSTLPTPREVLHPDGLSRLMALERQVFEGSLSQEEWVRQQTYHTLVTSFAHWITIPILSLGLDDAYLGMGRETLIFRALNIPGAPIDPAEVEDLITTAKRMNKSEAVP